MSKKKVNFFKLKYNNAQQQAMCLREFKMSQQQQQ